MKTFTDENGRVTAIMTETTLNTTTDNQPLEAPPAQLAYLRYCPLQKFPAEMAVKHGEHYFVVAINREQLINMLATGTDLLREFDRKPVEDTEIE